MADLQGENRVVAEGVERTWDALAREAEAQLSVPLAEIASRRTAFVVDSPLAAVRALALMVRGGLDALVLDRARWTEGMAQAVSQAGFHAHLPDGAIVPPAQAPARIVPGRVGIFSSGTTGTPKLLEHSWATLHTMKALREAAPRRWLVPYQVGTYAWYQLLTLGLFVPRQDLVLRAPTDLPLLFEEAARHGVSAISATPTFWRLALMQVAEEALRCVPLAQISLGGEVVDQAILDQLGRLFPQAKRTHIYASSEVGACIVVHDGQAGFPAAWLSRSGEKELRLQDGRLFVRSTNAAHTAPTDAERWVDTGDLVEVRGERVHFLGRADARLINVGGNKAYPGDVEATLLRHPDVQWARVRARRAPLVGNLAAAEVFARSQKSAAELEVELTRFCAERLPEYAVPRVWTFVDRIPVSANLKSEIA